MHESLRSMRWSWVGFGWFIAVCLTSAILLALEAFGLIAEGAPGETLWVAVALATGFLATGIFIGTRVAAAPVLHGAAMGVASLIAWFLVNLLLGEPLDASAWGSLDPMALGAMLVLQAASAVVGTRAGVRWVRRRRDE